MTVASRVAVMDNGMIKQIATPGEIYEAPNSTYVADFIGEVNIIQGRVAGTGAQIQIAWAEDQADLIATTDLDLGAGDTAYLAIRPEKIAISGTEPQARNKVAGTVLDIAYLGNISTYHVELPNGLVLKAQTANTDRRKRADFTWEEPVWLSWSEAAGVVLDR